MTLYYVPSNNFSNSSVLAGIIHKLSSPPVHVSFYVTLKKWAHKSSMSSQWTPQTNFLHSLNALLKQRIFSWHSAKWILRHRLLLLVKKKKARFWKLTEVQLNSFLYLPVRFVFRFSSLQFKDILAAGFQPGTPAKTVNNHSIINDISCSSPEMTSYWHWLSGFIQDSAQPQEIKH